MPFDYGVGRMGSAADMNKISLGLGNLIDSDRHVSQGDYKITPDGGFAVKCINRTGETSTKGKIVSAGTVDDEVILAPASSPDFIGVIYTGGVAEGGEMFVVVKGIAEVLYGLVGATAGSGVSVSATEAGLADGSGSGSGLGYARRTAAAESLGKVYLR